VRRYLFMNNWEFGVTMLVVGMGGTLLTLWILSLLMSALKKLFPIREEQGDKA
jgi:hypothetical protein